MKSHALGKNYVNNDANNRLDITEESKFNSMIYVNTYLNDTGNDLKF